MAKEILLAIRDHLITNTFKVLSAVPTSTVVIAATYKYGWIVQNLALVLVTILQYTIMDLIRRKKVGSG